MDPGPLSTVADKFQWVFAEALLNACGKDVKFSRRTRIITPLRLGLALTATCASHRVETLADFHRGFKALFDTTMTYKAFYNVSPQKSVAESPCSSRLPRGGKTGILTRSTRNVSPLERAALCLKTLTCTASPMNRHANSSGGCLTCWKT